MTNFRSLARPLALAVALAALLILGAGRFNPARADKPGPAPSPAAAERSPLSVDSNPDPHGPLPTRLAQPPQPPPVATQPPNDYFTQALTVESLPYESTEETTQATRSLEDPAQSLGNCNEAVVNNHSVWFAYTAPDATPLTAYTFGSNYDTVLSAHTGTWGNLQEVTCNDDYIPGSNLQSQIAFTPITGTTYYFDITSYGTSLAGTLIFSLRDNVPPPNDDFDNARPMNPMPYTDSVDTFAATRAADDPVLPCPSPPSQQSSSVWYQYTPTTAGTLIVDTIGSDYDTVLAVWTGVRGALTNVGCNDDQSGQQSLVQVSMAAHTTYYVEVVAKGSLPGGNLVINAHVTIPQWQVREPLSLARDRLGLASDGAFLYAVGGERYFTDAPVAYGPTAVVSRYDPALNFWEDVSPLPTALSDLKVVYVAGKVYVPAAYAGSGPPFYGTHLVYDVVGDDWSTAANAPWPNGRPPIFYSLAGDGQGYYLTGGFDGTAILNATWYYRVSTNSWSQKASLGTARFGHESTFLSGNVFVVAGDEDGQVPGLFSTERYDPAANTWADAPPEQEDRVFGGSGIAPSLSQTGSTTHPVWYLTGGGFSSYGSVLASTELFDPALNHWELLADDYNLTVPRYHFGAASLQNMLYAVGGFDNTSPGTLAANERLGAGSNQSLSVWQYLPLLRYAP